MEEVIVECKPYNSKRYSSSRIYSSELCTSRYTKPCSNLPIRKAGRLLYLLESESGMLFSCEYDQASRVML